MPDILRSPSDPGHEYVIGRTDPSTPLPGDIDNVVICSIEDGFRTFTPDDLNADALRFKPRLGGKTTRQIIAAANVRWALEDRSAPTEGFKA